MNQDIRDEVCCLGGEEALLFCNPDFDEAIVGVTTDGRAVYDFERMVEDMAVRDSISSEEAAEFIDYNTIQSIPYAGEYAPVIMYPIIRPEVSRE